MKKLNCFSTIFLLIASLFTTVSLANANVTPVGYWKQYDDHTHQLESILNIYEKNGELFATPIKAFVVNGRQPDVYCTKCTGERKDKKIIGMTVMWGMKQLAATKWGHGRIVDPKSGKIYRCEVALINAGETLKVRGYIGISLLGRSQVWQRTAAPAK